MTVGYSARTFAIMCMVLAGCILVLAWVMTPSHPRPRVAAPAMPTATPVPTWVPLPVVTIGPVVTSTTRERWR